MLINLISVAEQLVFFSFSFSFSFSFDEEEKSRVEKNVSLLLDLLLARLIFLFLSFRSSSSFDDVAMSPDVLFVKTGTTSTNGNLLFYLTKLILLT